ncbi:sulfate adenylyltransferase subunit CysN [Buchnera aphidicola]|uniref:sulfate adenylyltransferase subunit CysN n=1 Tax=Buchnera aphidicola TaxID=9 RepID=UPI003464522F
MNSNINTKIKTSDNFKSWCYSDKNRPLLRCLTCGSVDDGKSTLIGRLLHDTQQIYVDQLNVLKNDSKRYGTQDKDTIDLALLVDGLQDEREQGITIDVAYRYFSTNQRKFIIADTPGHEQYTRNMVTGASTCDLSILLVDARKGLSKQTYRHTFISSLLGIKYFIVAINKMDLVEYKKDIYLNIKKQFLIFSEKISHNLKIFFVPISSLLGDNIVFPSSFMAWYDGITLLRILETIDIHHHTNIEEIRFPVQYINRPNANFRGYSGTLVSGKMLVGQKIKILPANISSRIARIVTFEKDLKIAYSGQAITVVLEDDIDISRGDFLVNVNSDLIAHKKAVIDVVWMTDTTLLVGQEYMIKLSGKKTRVYIEKILYTIDINTLKKIKSNKLSLNNIGRIQIIFNIPMIFDSYQDNRFTGNIILIDLLTNNTVGAGMIVESINEKIIKKEPDMKQFELDLRSLICQYFPHWSINIDNINKGCK